MSKVFTYAILSVGMMLVLNIMGIPTGVSSILSWIGLSGSSQTVDVSLFITTILAVFAGTALVTGIFIGLLTRSTAPESYLIAPLMAQLAVFVGTFTSVINYASAATGNDWSSKVILVIMAPVAIGYGISLISYWRGAE